MKRISVELIPRNLSSLESETRLIKESFPQVNAINIPDLLKFKLRSWEAVSSIINYFPYSIPHIRAMDFPINDPIALKPAIAPLIEHINKYKIPALLIIRGDEPKDSNKKTFETSSANLISYFKKEMPHLKIYGAIDQYRGSMDSEFRYIKEKIDVGADGFFTQPFFDIATMEDYENKLNKETQNIEIFWGVSPVCTEQSKHYWQNLNSVVFPQDFDLSLESNTEFAREALKLTEELNSNIYLMPIKIDLKDYLINIFS